MRKLTDRTLVLVLGLAIAAGGAALADWDLQKVLDLPGKLDTTSALDLVDAGWWPWAQGAAGVVVALLGLLWFLNRLPRRGPRTLGLGADRNGAGELDLGSLGSVLTDQLEQSGTVTGAHASFTRSRGTTAARVRARLTDEADLEALTQTADQVTSELSTALPNERLDLQLRVTASRRSRGTRPAQRGSVRIQ
jgi:hypothetical protein